MANEFFISSRDIVMSNDIPLKDCKVVSVRVNGYPKPLLVTNKDVIKVGDYVFNRGYLLKVTEDLGYCYRSVMLNQVGEVHFKKGNNLKVVLFWDKIDKEFIKNHPECLVDKSII